MVAGLALLELGRITVPIRNGPRNEIVAIDVAGRLKEGGYSK